MIGTGFERYWNNFSNRLRGSLMNEAKQQELTYNVASVLLSDAIMAWSLSYDECGAWLLRLKSENPQKGELVSQILQSDIKFTKIEPKKDLHPSVKTIAPVCGAALGFGISHALGAGVWTQIIATLAPAAVIYPATKSAEDVIRENNKSAVVDEYMAQLDKYKQSVILVLND